MSGNITNKRKIEHIKIVLEKEVEPVSPPFDKYSLPYRALPEVDFKEIDTSTKFWGKNLSFPFIISSMTGGPAKASVINKNLAIAAQKAKVALGLGPMRVVVRHPESADSFRVKKYCPDVPLFANVGLVQLNYGFGLDEIKRIIDVAEADGLFFHINPLQEVIQPEGDTNFKGLLKKLEKIINKIPIPVIAKEVGTGIDDLTAKRLFNCGIKWIDVSGLGGTNWTVVEAYRRKDKLGHLFGNVGVPTDEAIIGARKVKGLSIIAGGGIRNGIDIAKSIALGASLTTSAKPFLEPALSSPDRVYKQIMKFKKELEVSMFAMGVKNIRELSKVKLLK